MRNNKFIANPPHECHPFSIKQFVVFVIIIIFFCMAWDRCAGDTAVAASPEKSTIDISADTSNTRSEDPRTVRTLHESFQSSDPGETMIFPEERDFEGWKGILQNVEYEIIKEEPVTKQQTGTIEIELPWSETFPKAEAVMEKDGITYHLKDVLVEEAPVTGRRAKVTRNVFYRGYMEEPVVGNIHNTEYYDEETEETVKAVLPLDYIRKMYSSWKDDIFFTLRIEDVTADYYRLGDNLKKTDELPGAAEYPAILSVLELDSEKYRIENIWWADENRQTIYGQGSRYASDYMAVYEGDVLLPDMPGFGGTAVYYGEWEEETGEIIYTIRASAEYREKEIPGKWKEVVGGSVTAGSGMVFVLLLYRRKRRKNHS